ncbi:hypothetical protein POM88_016166 [Heracleum sosnowskyi]|uniref:Cytochrome P450 n=1 Tax=Heracleum sosnowskyi TaxID=360622 RepID=A0AAD8INF4_9APIA|nr:hypothetical protein POM88_016166 [Heracleum sosnowskyi]
MNLQFTLHKHGPIMHLQLAEISIIVVSSSSLANEVLKTHDLAFADRAQLQLSKIILEGCKDVAYSRYGDYWRQMKKISASGGGFDIADLFPSYKFLHAFSGLKSKLIKIRSRVDVIFFNIIKEHKEKRAKTKDSDGKVAGEEDLVDVLLRLQDQEGSFQFPITSSDIKGIIIDMLAAGTDTAKVMEKAQAEVRKGFKGKKKIQEVDVEDLSYLPKTCRRSCPGITFGIATMELPLALLLYHSDWKLPNTRRSVNI